MERDSSLISKVVARPSLVNFVPQIFTSVKLVDTGNTIIVIEHNLDLIKTADHIIDLGPEGGEAGGKVIAIGTPEQIVKNKDSQTGIFLKKYLE